MKVQNTVLRRKRSEVGRYGRGHGRLFALGTRTTEVAKASQFTRVDHLLARSKVGRKDEFWPRVCFDETRP